MSSRVRSLLGSENLRAPLATRPISSSTESAWLEELAHSLEDSSSASRELLSIRAEQDPELLTGALFSFASRHADDPIALTIYRRLSEHPEFYGSAAARLAHSRGEALQGRGSFGQRSEIFFSRFVRQAADPANLAGMAFAGVAFQGLRLAATSRLLASSSSNIFTRGIGPRLLANGLGFVGEAPIFSASVRGINALLGQKQDWSASVLGHELAAGYLMLGGLRLSGALGNAAIRRLDPAKVLGSSFQHRLVQQASMLAGISSAHWVEQRLGFRPDHGGGELLADSLATLLHFNVAGRLLHGLGSGRLNQELEMRQRNLESLRPNTAMLGEMASYLGPRLALANATPIDPAFRPEPMQMSLHTPGDGRPRFPAFPTSEGTKSPEVIASKRAPDIHERYREGISETMFNIDRYHHYAPAGSALWVETSIQVARFVAENCRADMSRVPAEHAATLEIIAQRLDQLHTHLELLRTSGNPMAPMDGRAIDLMGHLYRVPNPLVNYIDSGKHESLVAAARGAEEANKVFIREFLPMVGVNRDSGETSPELMSPPSRARVIHPSNQSWSKDSVPFYDFVDSINPDIDILPDVSRRVLLLGEVPRARGTLALGHEVKVSQVPSQAYDDLIAEASQYQVPNIGLLNASDRRTFEYVEAYNAFDAPTLLSAAGHAKLLDGFFDRIQAGGIGLWVSQDARSMELVVQTAIERRLADVIHGSYQGISPHRLEMPYEDAPSTEGPKTNYVFFRKLPQE